MTDTINHDLFGTLEKEIDEDGIIHLEGEISIGEGSPCGLHITGSGDTQIDEILQMAASAHEKFINRESELRSKAVNQAISDEHLQEVAEDVGEEISREEAIDGYSTIMVVNYFTEENEVSIYFEDESGLFGVDLNLVSDLTFSDIKTNADG